MSDLKKYEDTEGVRISHLAEILRSPVHYQWAVNNDTDKACYHFGRFFHTAVLEPGLLQSRYVKIDFETRPDQEHTMASNVNKAWKAGIYADAEERDMEVITVEDVALVQGMRKAIRQTAAARELIELPGTFEDWRTWEVDGVQCKGRRDRFIKAGNTILDLKMANDASTETFRRDAFKYLYHVKAAWYLDGFKADKFIWLVVEKNPPHAINIFTAEKELIDYGRMKYKVAITSLKQCREHYGLETGERRWPSYDFNENSWPDLTLPGWLKTT